MAAIMVRTQSRVMIIDPEDGVEKPKGLPNSNKSKKSKRIAKTALEEQTMKEAKIAAQEKLSEIMSRSEHFGTFVQMKAWNLLEDPNSSGLALFWAASIMFLIVLSCTCFVMETIPDWCCGRYDYIWAPIELVCITFFTIEYCSRFLLAPRHYGLQEDPEDAVQTYSEPFWSIVIKSRLRFTFSFLNAIDLVAILPFYIELMLGGAGGALSFVRIIRLARVFRLFKLGKYSEGLQMLGRTMTESFSSLAMICSMLAIFLILISTLMHYLERGTFCSAHNDFCDGTADGMGWFAAPHQYFGSFFEHGTCSSANWCRDESFFQNIFISNYWSLTTMTTTGYGDVYPKTFWGQLFGSLIMFSGLLLLALPISIISGNFVNCYDRMEWDKEQKKIKAEEAARAFANMTADEKAHLALIKENSSFMSRVLGRKRGQSLGSISPSTSSRESFKFDMGDSDKSLKSHRHSAPDITSMSGSRPGSFGKSPKNSETLSGHLQRPSEAFAAESPLATLHSISEAKSDTDINRIGSGSSCTSGVRMRLDAVPEKHSSDRELFLDLTDDDASGKSGSSGVATVSGFLKDRARVNAAGTSVSGGHFGSFEEEGLGANNKGSRIKGQWDGVEMPKSPDWVGGSVTTVQDRVERLKQLKPLPVSPTKEGSPAYHGRMKYLSSDAPHSLDRSSPTRSQGTPHSPADGGNKRIALMKPLRRKQRQEEVLSLSHAKPGHDKQGEFVADDPSPFTGVLPVPTLPGGANESDASARPASGDSCAAAAAAAAEAVSGASTADLLPVNSRSDLEEHGAAKNGKKPQIREQQQQVRPELLVVDYWTKDPLEEIRKMLQHHDQVMGRSIEAMLTRYSDMIERCVLEEELAVRLATVIKNK